MDDEFDGHGLNPFQRGHLLTSCQYADKLLSEIEAVLSASQTKSPFPQFKSDISPAQAKVVQDYIARMRAQIVRILESQGIPIPAPKFGSVHSIRVTLGFVDIAFDEVRPKRMAGYGKVAPNAATELSGLVDEMQGIASRLDAYLAQGHSADLEKRLRRLEDAGSDVALVKVIERAMNRHGLVEFRPALATIIDRLETQAFEIAVFGRVSSGKSSLLNHIAGQNVLPVGVTPVTAVPTRLVYGVEPRATAWFADRKPEQFGIERLAELVTEQLNPSNREHVTRIVVELPAARLHAGIVYVDTPGLGSLATAGAAETRAYLPQCDLGIVLVDAGSTLTADDLATIQTLYDAGTPASVLLSKADLLSPDDRDRALRYMADAIRSELGVSPPVHAISVKAGHTGLLENWLQNEILALYDRHTELARQSLNRKIGALRLGVEAALRARARRPDRGRAGAAKRRDLETELRRAAGTIAETRTACARLTDELRDSAAGLIRRAAAALVTAGEMALSPAESSGYLKARLEGAAAEDSARIALLIEEAARKAGRTLTRAARLLDMENRPEDDELSDVVKNMPRFDVGELEIDIWPGAAASVLGRRWAAGRVERRIKKTVGPQIAGAASTYERVLQAWVRRTLAELQARFDSYADAYRAQLARLAGDQAPGAEEKEALREDLAALAGAAGDELARQDAPGAVV
ncbi:MAG TPA: dynamin family protein [Bryobacteraceae bacterium]|nr:dynamin family protein [Bryobacteraceae bacterium]